MDGSDDKKPRPGECSSVGREKEELDDLQESGEKMVIALIGGTAAGIFVQAPLQSNRPLAIGVAIASGLLLIVAGSFTLYAARLSNSGQTREEAKGLFIYIVIGMVIFLLGLLASVFGIGRF